MGSVNTLKAGDRVRRWDTKRRATIVEVREPWTVAYVQFDSNSGEEDWIAVSLLERIPDEQFSEEAA